MQKPVSGALSRNSSINVGDAGTEAIHQETSTQAQLLDECSNASTQTDYVVDIWMS